MRAMAKKPTKTKVQSETVTPIKETIPDNLLRDFCSVRNFYKVDAHHLFGDRWRLNYWSQAYQADRVVPTSRIEKSFFVQYSEGVIRDLTIHERAS